MKITITHMKKNDWIYTLMFALFTIVFVLTASITYADDYTNDRDKMYDQCSMKFRGDFKMIDYCFGLQIRSYNNVSKYYDKYLSDVDPSNISDEGMLIINCSSKWRDVTFDTYKWDLIDYCISSSI